ncbi:MAG: MoxR family ATPase [Spirochaetales bacterium]|nr:MoxR family ATPase [Spirochaetales bacterium]
MKEIKKWSEDLVAEISTVFLGKKKVVEKILVSLLCGGHVLLEDVPGVGKTILARGMAVLLGGVFRRIQCTPDLLPADVLGVSVYNPKTGDFTFLEGPVNGNVVLVDEINRATPRTQSALLEAMAEGQISVDGSVRSLPKPFLILATENPVEFEGTFPLPEAQKDRFFMSLNIGYPDKDAEAMILEAQRRITHPLEDLKAVTSPDAILVHQQKVVDVFVDEKIRSYILEIVARTRSSKYLRLGVSPRGSLALYKGAQALAAIRGRDYTVPEDVKELALPVLNKRVIVKSEYLIKGYTSLGVLEDIIAEVPVPVLGDAVG